METRIMAHDRHATLVDAESGVVPPESKFRRYSTKFKIFVFIAYYAVGILVFGEFERWNLIDSMYFITVTTTTVGYGYFHPSNEHTRLFDIFYILFGCSVILSFANEFAKTVLVGSQDELVSFLSKKLFDRSELSLQEFQKARTMLSIFAVSLCLLIGSLVYSGLEDWTYLDGLYWTVCTMTTVGYGDLEIKHDTTRIFGIFFIFTCVLVYAVAFNNILDEWGQSLLDADHRDKLASLTADKFDDRWIKNTMPKVGEGCSKDRFILSVLAEMDVIDFPHHITPLIKLFKSLDCDKLGYLTAEQLAKVREYASKLSERTFEAEFELNPLHDIKELCKAESNDSTV